MKLIQCLITNQVLTTRKIKPRFIYIILSIIAVILFIALWDKLVAIVDEPLTTSIYWKGVF